MIKRAIARKVASYARQYPVVTITGPRQSGKTTLARSLFPKMKYLNLEALDVRQYAKNDPRGFVNECARGAVIDEIQRAPDILSYIQVKVDESGQPGQFILTGSQNFNVMKHVTQTLAGRTALATLLPFSFSELYTKRSTVDLDKVLFSGFYPRIYDKKLNPTEALSFYVQTYLDRDIRTSVNIKDLSRFETFLKICAASTGQIINLSNIGNDCGINHNTAKSWISVLEASYIIRLLRPYYRNFRKRLVKAPKLYFIDVGLACNLLGITSVQHVSHHPLRGALFETFAVTEVMKNRLNEGRPDNLYYFRDNIGNEIDLVMDMGKKSIPIEIKASRTINYDFIKGINYYKKINRDSSDGYLIYGGLRSYKYEGVSVLGYRDIGAIDSGE